MFRIVITPIITESGFRDKKEYEVQEEKDIVRRKGFKKTITKEWVPVGTFDNIGDANKLLKEKLK